MARPHPDTVVFALSGGMDIEHATGLQEFLANEANGRVALDLKDVDRAAVQFLAGVDAAGIPIVNCPEYVSRWIAAERDGQHQHTREPDKQEPQP